MNGGFVTIVFRRPARTVTVRGDSETVQKDTRNVPEEYQKQLFQKLSPIQKDIVAYLSYNPTAGRRELSERIDGLTEAKAQYHLRKLQRDGAIKRIGADRGGYWEILVTIRYGFNTIDKNVRVLFEREVIERRGSKKTGGYYVI